MKRAEEDSAEEVETGEGGAGERGSGFLSRNCDMSPPFCSFVSVEDWLMECLKYS